MSKKINGMSSRFWKIINYPPRQNIENLAELSDKRKRSSSFFQRMRDSYKKIKK
jgi:hypothetical protein